MHNNLRSLGLLQMAESLLGVTKAKIAMTLLLFEACATLSPSQSEEHVIQSPKNSSQKSSTTIAKSAKPSFVSLVVYDESNSPIGFGSGFFISTNLIATNFHVIKAAAKIVANFPERHQSFVIEAIIKYDQENDLAILRSSQPVAAFLPLGNSDQLAVGEKIFALGSPEGLESTFSEGIVSGLRQQYGLIQITAPISPGSSGGPILNSRGEIIGVAVAFLKEGQNLNFAVPINTLKTLNHSKPISEIVDQPEKNRTKSLNEIIKNSGICEPADGGSDSPARYFLAVIQTLAEVQLADSAYLANGTEALLLQNYALAQQHLNCSFRHIYPYLNSVNKVIHGTSTQIAEALLELREQIKDDANLYKEILNGSDLKKGVVVQHMAESSLAFKKSNDMILMNSARSTWAALAEGGQTKTLVITQSERRKILAKIKEKFGKLSKPETYAEQSASLLKKFFLQQWKSAADPVSHAH